MSGQHENLSLPDGNGGWMRVTVQCPQDGAWTTVMGGGNASPGVPFIPDTGPLRNIATDCGVLQNPWTPGGDGGATLTRHLLHANAATITVAFLARPNGRPGSGMEVGAETPLRAWVRPAGGTWSPLSFDGAWEVTLPETPANEFAGAVDVYSDPLDGEWGRGTEIEVITWMQSSTSTYGCQGDLKSPYDVGRASTSAASATSQPTSSYAASGRGARPSAIIAESPQKSSWVMIGDSNSVNAHMSHGQQAMRARRLPYIVNGRHGESTKNVATTRWDFQMGTQMQWCDSVYSMLLANDMGMALADVQNNLLTFWQKCRDAGATRVVQALCPPKGYVHPDGRVMNPPATLVSTNAWLRDGAPLIDGSPAAVGASGAVRATVVTDTLTVVRGSDSHPLGQGWVADVVTPLETVKGNGFWKPEYHSGGDLVHYYGKPHDVQAELFTKQLALMGF